jgi:ferredoxin-NADP reductase/Na+-translocating ferredoxin:NAD+ oxidoreductase RnfD subunit
MIAWIDNLLNRVTMYRLVLYYLASLLAAAFIFGFFGILPYDPTAIAFSTVVVLAACWGTNWVAAKLFGAVTNVESAYITALILALIIPPVTAANHAGVGFLVFASVWAMASKYLFALGKRHLFNPAAFGVALSALVIGQSATWWAGGNLPLLPFVLAGGLLIVRKLQRFDLVAAFTAALFVAVAATSSAGNAVTGFEQTLLHSAFFFFAFIMLTEPLTTPPTRTLRIAYGAFVGFLFAPNVHFGSLYLSPELALLAGNVLSYAISPKGRFMLALKSVQESAKDTYDFVFAPDRRPAFAPGQYMEWTLGHRYPDNRGNRRYFTIASSPTESDVHLGVKFYPQASTFKRALAGMKTGDKISASHIAGGFTLPRDPRKKLVFIAGGIGATPFRSMMQYLLDRGEARPIAMLYSNKTSADIAYKETFDRAAAELGIKTVYALTDEKPSNAFSGPINAALIRREIPDYLDRTFYISGPHAMVEAFKKTLREMGVSRFRIKSDFFPGFA